MLAAAQGRDTEVSTLLTNGADALIESKAGLRASEWASRYNSQVYLTYV